VSRGRFRLAALAALVGVGGVAAAVWVSQRLHGDTGLIAVTGTVEATQVDVSAKTTGRVVELAVREGQRVPRGRLIARLDTESLEADVRRAEAAVREAEARLRDLLAGARPEEIREAEARLARAEAQLQDLLAGARREEIEQARASLHHAAARREWAQRELHRTRELFARDLVAAQEVDRARQGYETAAADEAAARERLALLEAGPRPHEIAAARAEVRAARARLSLLEAGPRPAEVDAARARLNEARAALEVARTRLDDARLLSPIDGVVLRKNVEAGETVNPGVPIVTLIDPTDVWLRAYVPETDVGRLRIGQAATITVDAYPGRAFPGEVTEIASEAEYTPRNVQTRKERVNLVFRIKIAVRNPEGVLKPGLPADAEIHP
jgi:HlyD family secretion protein